MAVIRVEIEQLTLTGVRPGRRDRVLAAFHRELTRLLTVDGLPEISAGDREHVTGGARLTSTRDPDRLGHQLAHSVYTALADVDAPESASPGTGADSGWGR
jgi:hypothetical protein